MNLYDKEILHSSNKRNAIYLGTKKKRNLPGKVGSNIQPKKKRK